jgi:hypothetical protein
VIERIFLVLIIAGCTIMMAYIWNELLMDYVERKNDAIVLFLITVGVIVASIVGASIIMILEN